MKKKQLNSKYTQLVCLLMDILFMNCFFFISVFWRKTQQTQRAEELQTKLQTNTNLFLYFVKGVTCTNVASEILRLYLNYKI